MARLFAPLTFLVLALALAGPALAHRLNVFASVEGEEVVVETGFSTGRIPVAGEVRVEDAEGTLVATYDLSEDGTLRFPLDREAVAAGGLSITVTVGEHEGYWLLTPADLEMGS